MSAKQVLKKYARSKRSRKPKSFNLFSFGPKRGRRKKLFGIF